MAEINKHKFFLSTPLYYVNDIPHIGHTYTTIMADVIKRFKELCGFQVFFLTGTDEHGQKIEKSAKKQNISPKQLADNMVLHYQKLWKTLNINYDKFIRTTDAEHVAGVRKLFTKSLEKGDIYPGNYQGHYCISCESFVSDTAESSADGNKICPDCGKKTEQVSEKCYFFKLSAYQQPLLDYYQANPDFIIPKTRMNEVVSFVKMGLRDLSITRSTVKWGITVPGDDEQTIYVWFDALSNYINAVNYAKEDETFKSLWPADLHIMGKDILKFHAVYWPAFLMSAGIIPPKQELIHGWWLKDEKKMSKSSGNVLDPQILLKHFSTDCIRYYLMREASIGADGNFSHEGFIMRSNTDLANDWGNLVSRTSGMIGKYFQGSFSISGDYSDQELQIKTSYLELENQVMELFSNYQYNRGLEAIFEYIRLLNRYIDQAQPWSLAKDTATHPRLAAVLKTLIRGILSVNTLLSPIIPKAAEELKKIVNAEVSGLGWKDLPEIFSINRINQLFPRVEIKDFFADQKISIQDKPEKTGKEVNMDQNTENLNLISIEEFKKVEMVAALVIQAEPLEGADKLLKLVINTGTDERTLVAGIAKYYSPESILNKKILMVKNLKPAKIRGVLSNGMILAATDPKTRQPYLPILPDETPIGAILS